MKSLKLNIHSFIDVITNSSTETFLCAHSGSVDMTKEVIDEILRLSGCEKTADDLFEFVFEDDDSSGEKVATLNVRSKDGDIDLGTKLAAIFDTVEIYN